MKIKRYLRGQNLEYTTVESTVHNLIWPIWPWRWQRCERARCLNKRPLFSSPNGAIFSAIRSQISPIIRHNRALWQFCTYPGIWRRLHLVNPRNRWSSTFRSIGQWLIFLEQIRQWSPLFRLFLGRWRLLVIHFPACPLNQFFTVAIEGEKNLYTAS